jgi:hypothetical protein
MATITDKQKSDASYAKMCEKHGVQSMELFVGNKNDYYERVWKNNAQNEVDRFFEE